MGHFSCDDIWYPPFFFTRQTVTRFLTLQRRKEEQACALRLRYIRARNAVAELETFVRKLETLGPGLYVAQYEQLYIDYQNFTNKIEGKVEGLESFGPYEWRKIINCLICFCKFMKYLAKHWF